MKSFTETAQDFESWISQSKQHKYIAELAWDEFFRLKKVKVYNSDDLLKGVAMMSCVMMHWGFSIEKRGQDA